MIFWRSFKLGCRRIIQARRYILVVYMLSLAISLSLAVLLSQDIQTSLGNSVAAERLRVGFDDLWFKGFSSEAQGIAKTFHPAVTGIGAVFEGLDALITGKLGKFQGALYFALIYWGLWIYLSAGFIGMFYNGAFDGVFGQHFFAEAGRYFFRFLLLSLIAAVVYMIILGLLLPLVSDWVKTMHRDTILEPRFFRDVLLKYLGFWMVILLVNVIFDYSKIIIIGNDVRKKDIWRVPLAAAWFVATRPLKIFLLFFLTSLSWLLLILLYWLVAPGAWQASWFTILFAFMLGQIFILGKIAVRCLFYAGETALYYYEATLPSTEARRLPEKIDRDEDVSA